MWGEVLLGPEVLGDEGTGVREGLGVGGHEKKGVDNVELGGVGGVARRRTRSLDGETEGDEVEGDQVEAEAEAEAEAWRGWREAGA